MTKPFGTWNGQTVSLLTLQNEHIQVELLNYGAALRSIRVKDRTGEWVDICLGWDTLEEYLNNKGCFGATIGRYANRIAHARYTWNGVEYALSAGRGGHHLHGGDNGFHRKLWDFDCGADWATLSVESPDGEEGYPGNLKAQVTFRLEGSALILDYKAVCDRDTPLSLTNHAYFNLAGHDGGAVDDHVLTLRAGRYTPVGENMIPTGELTDVTGTALDLRVGAVLGERMYHPDLPRGFDHNFALDGDSPAAVVWCPRTGIGMEMTTTLEGVQVFTGGVRAPCPGKGGAIYGPQHALCLETQHFPDAVNQPNFPPAILRAGEEYRETTAYRFFVSEVRP